MDKLLYKITISGRVQGVGFRYHAMKEARARSINGIVRNSSDGTVYIEAEGPKEQLDNFLEWCREGPSFANVGSVKVESSDPVNYDDFSIVR